MFYTRSMVIYMFTEKNNQGIDTKIVTSDAEVSHMQKN